MQLDIEHQRKSWDEARLAMARELAKRSLCSRDKVGAIITDTDNRIIGEGYNGPPSGFRHNDQPCTEWCVRGVVGAFEQGDIENLPSWASDSYRQGPGNINYNNCPALHAEANALLMTDRSLRAGGTIYITSFPCADCRKLISNSGLKRMVIGVDGEHEYRYRQNDYIIFALLGMAVVFEDNRDGVIIMEPKAATWFGMSQFEYWQKLLSSSKEKSSHHQRNSNGLCVYGCDPNSTNCD